MNLEQLHKYLGDLIEAGTDPKLPVVLPGLNPEDRPQELSESIIIEGLYQANPTPFARANTEAAGRGLMLHGTALDLDVLRETYRTEWPLVDAPLITES